MNAKNVCGVKWIYMAKKKQTKEQALSELTQYFQVKGQKQGWHGMEMQSKNVVMIDPGTGKPYTWRQWTFKFDKDVLQKIPDNSIDIIITSPPYANTYDYYLYHKFRKRWLDLDVKFAQYNEIGSRREYSSLKEKKEKWNEDLIKCFKEMQRVLKPKHFAFIVIGDSVIKKELIKIEKEISNFAPTIGFKVNEIISSDLSSHSKIFNPSYAQKGKKEHLITLQKI